LQAITNIDTHRTDLDAMPAVDALTNTLALPFLRCSKTPALLGPALRSFAFLRVVGNDQRVMIEHSALEAGIGAHVDANLLARQTGHDEGRDSQEKGGEISSVGCLTCK